MRISLIYIAFCLGILFPGAGGVSAQDGDEVTFNLELSKEKLGINERLRVDFVMNKDGDNFTPPDFEGFKVIIGPSQAISSSWINGVRKFSKTYSYTLAPVARGKFTIGQATIVISGETYKTTPKVVEVTAAVDQPMGDGSSTLGQIADENLHLVAEVSKLNPYMNEAISVVYKLYVSPKINVSHFDPLDNPKYNNFWSQEIPFSRYNVQQGMYDGKPYRYVVLKRVVLYPQKSGKLEIEPLSLDVTLEVPTDKRDFFGSRIYTETNKTVSAGRRTIDVKPLPENGKPEGFSGAVGQFEFDVDASRTALNATESLQAQVVVKGKGNLKLFQLPELNLPAALEVYEPEVEQDVRTTLGGMQGSVSNDYTVVPAFKGKYPIPQIQFSYFDPKLEKYVQLTSEEITIDVLEGPLAATAPSVSANTANKTPVTGLNQFHFIKLNANLSTIGWNTFFASSRYFAWFFAPMLIIPLFILFRKKKEEKERDITGNRIRRANKLAKKYLFKARRELGEKESFYVALEKALHNYLKAKLKIETSEFSKDRIRNLLSGKKVDQETIDRFLELLTNCEMARYSPFSDVEMQEDYDKASDVITILDKEL